MEIPMVSWVPCYPLVFFQHGGLEDPPFAGWTSPSSRPGICRNVATWQQWWKKCGIDMIQSWKKATWNRGGSETKLQAIVILEMVCYWVWRKKSLIEQGIYGWQRIIFSLHHVSGSQLKGGGMTRIFAAKMRPPHHAHLHLSLSIFTYIYIHIHIHIHFTVTNTHG